MVQEGEGRQFVVSEENQVKRKCPKAQTVPHAVVVKPTRGNGVVTFYLRGGKAAIDGGGGGEPWQAGYLSNMIADWTQAP